MTDLRTHKGRDVHTYSATSYPPTSQGTTRQAQDLSGCTKASLVDGDLTWEAVHGGAWANNIRVIHETGETGPVSRPLAITAEIEDEVVTVIWRTDGAGDPVAPTPTEVVAEAAGVPDLDMLVTLVDGGSTPLTVLDENLAGGADDGDWLRVNGLNGLQVINTVV